MILWLERIFIELKNKPVLGFGSSIHQKMSIDSTIRNQHEMEDELSLHCRVIP